MIRSSMVVVPSSFWSQVWSASGRLTGHVDARVLASVPDQHRPRPAEEVFGPGHTGGVQRADQGLLGDAELRATAVGIAQLHHELGTAVMARADRGGDD